MDKSQKKELKNKYLKEQWKNDIAFQLLAIRENQIQQTSSINKTAIENWTDQQLENKIIDYVFNQFQQAGKPSRHQNRQVWERELLWQLPIGIQAVFATYLFESDLSLHGSVWDFFCQNNGAFAIDALTGYKLMQNRQMVELIQQCIGAYLQMKKSGENDRLMCEPHRWNIEEEHYSTIHQKSFEEIDEQYKIDKLDSLDELLATLKFQKIMFIRKNTELFETQK